MSVVRWLGLGAWFAIAPACDGACFVGDTRVWTPKGPRRIADLREGDEVWSWSFAQGRAVARRVVAVMRHEVDGVLRLRAGELAIAGVSATHPMWSATASVWRAAGELALGERLVGWLGAGDAREIAIDEIEQVPGRTEVFNLTVEVDHTYFAEGLLAHNKSPEADGDADGDGHYAIGYDEASDDCDDEDASVNPDADEVCDDQIDNDCDGDTDDADEDCAPAR